MTVTFGAMTNPSLEKHTFTFQHKRSCSTQEVRDYLLGGRQLKWAQETE